MGPFVKAVTKAIERGNSDLWATFYGSQDLFAASIPTWLYSVHAIDGPEQDALCKIITEQELIIDGVTRTSIEKRRTRRGLNDIYGDN